MVDFPEITRSMIEDPALPQERARWLRDVALVTKHTLDAGGTIDAWMARFQPVRLSILRQVWNATIPESLRQRAVYIRFGSSGRGEDLLTSDLDHGVIAESTDVIGELRPFLGEFIDRMSQFGFLVCQGFVMSTNPRWVETATGWHRRLEAYFQFPDWEHVRYLFIALDGTPLVDPLDIWGPLHHLTVEGIAHSPFICWEMAHLGIHRSVALGRFRRVRHASGHVFEAIHVKDGLITPILHAIRLLTVAHGFGACSTPARLRHIEEHRLLPSHLTERCRDTLRYAIHLRLQKQVEDVLEGREPSDVIPIGERMGHGVVADRDSLVGHLEVAKALERFVHKQFRKPR